MIVKLTLLLLGTLLFLVTFIPLIRNDYWVFRVFEFPRFQKWWIGIIIFSSQIAFGVYNQDTVTLCAASFTLLVIVYLSYQVYPFTFIASRHIKSNKDPHCSNIRLIVSNVYQYNRKSHKLIRRLSKYEADVMIFVETDLWWKEQLVAAYDEEFPYQVLEPLENTYGMLLFSKLALEDVQIRYLIKEGIPSMKVTISHPEQKIRLFAVHPEPPVPSENPRSTERDQELLKIAHEASQETLPVLVAGDLNDVAWSYTTKRFVEESGLLDPRRGRGMFSTFHANYPLFRWPLDHVFCSKTFKLNRITTLRRVGSDHLPIYVDFAIPCK